MSVETPSRQLLRWFDTVRRSLPWRRDRDPYRVWVSEIMLQQTRVETAIPYYEKFLEAFPDVQALARADEAKVRARWSGLGYYRRARMLWQAARKVDHDGAFPRTSQEWQELPGVGPYTAAAIASIVFDEPVLALDGNVERVLCRLEAHGENPKSAAGRKFLSQAGLAWLDADRPGDSNQALMELGALVCLPRKPRCEECPVSSECMARADDTVDSFPVRRSMKRQVERHLLTVCVRRKDRLLLYRRDDTSRLLGGTWELPWVDSDSAGAISKLAERYGGKWILGRPLGSVRHTITNHKLVVTINEGEVRPREEVAEASKVAETRWASLAELDALPHSSLVRKVFLTATA